MRRCNLRRQTALAHPPPSGDAYHGEIVYQLSSPDGTSVTLIGAGTYSGGADIGMVSVTLDDSASSVVGGGAPVTGTYEEECNKKEKK